MLPHDGSAHVVDAGAVVLWITSAADMAPRIAALLSVVWFAIRVAETKTVQALLGKYAWVKSYGRDDEEDGR